MAKRIKNPNHDSSAIGVQAQHEQGLASSPAEDTRASAGGASEGEEGAGNRDASDRDRIAQRAYELYKERGGSDGLAEEDWFNAERELAGRKSHPA